MTTAATQKRLDAIQAITDLAIDPENGYQVRPEITVGKVLKAIRDLKKLATARHRRWGLAIVRWEEMVLGCDDFEIQSEEWKRHMHWAILQGGVYAVHATV